MATVTVGIPTYNRSRLLQEAIQSVLAQDFDDYEVLVSDNASTDDTEQVVAAHGDRRIRYVRQARNIGPNFNYRFVLEAAESEYVAFLSDDDLFLPNHLSTGIAALRQYPSAVYFASHAVQHYEDREVVVEPPTIPHPLQDELTFVPAQQVVNFLGMDTPGLAHMVCRRNAIPGIRNWCQEEFRPTDILIMPQLMMQGGFCYGATATTRVRILGPSASRQGDRAQRLRFHLMVWHTVRYLACLYLAQGICDLRAIEDHGLSSVHAHHVVPLVLGLGSFAAPAPLQRVAQKVFRERTDMDAASARFRLARRLGFWAIPVMERLEQTRYRWNPRRERPLPGFAG